MYDLKHTAQLIGDVAKVDLGIRALLMKTPGNQRSPIAVCRSVSLVDRITDTEGRKEVYTRHSPLVNTGKSLATVVDTD